MSNRGKKKRRGLRGLFGRKKKNAPEPADETPPPAVPAKKKRGFLSLRKKKKTSAAPTSPRPRRDSFTVEDLDLDVAAARKNPVVRNVPKRAVQEEPATSSTGPSASRRGGRGRKKSTGPPGRALPTKPKPAAAAAPAPATPKKAPAARRPGAGLKKPAAPVPAPARAPAVKKPVPGAGLKKPAPARAAAATKKPAPAAAVKKPAARPAAKKPVAPAAVKKPAARPTPKKAAPAVKKPAARSAAPAVKKPAARPAAKKPTATRPAPKKAAAPAVKKPAARPVKKPAARPAAAAATAKKAPAARRAAAPSAKKAPAARAAAPAKKKPGPSWAKKPVVVAAAAAPKKPAASTSAKKSAAPPKKASTAKPKPKPKRELNLPDPSDDESDTAAEEAGGGEEEKQPSAVIRNSMKIIGDSLRGLWRSLAAGFYFDETKLVEEGEEEETGEEGADDKDEEEEEGETNPVMAEGKKETGEVQEEEEEEEKTRDVHLSTTHPLIQKLHGLCCEFVKALEEEGQGRKEGETELPPLVAKENPHVGVILSTIIEILQHGCSLVKTPCILSLLIDLPVCSDYGWNREFAELSRIYTSSVSDPKERDVLYLKYVLQRRGLQFSLNDLLHNQPELIQSRFAEDAIVRSPDSVGFFLHLVGLFQSAANSRCHFPEIPSVFFTSDGIDLIAQFRTHVSRLLAYFVRCETELKMAPDQIGNEETNPLVGHLVRDVFCRSLANVFTHGLRTERSRLLGVIGKETTVWDMFSWVVAEEVDFPSRLVFSEAAGEGLTIEGMMETVVSLVSPRARKAVEWDSSVFPPRRVVPDEIVITYDAPTISRIRCVVLFCMCLNHNCLKEFLSMMVGNLLDQDEQLLQSFYDETSVLRDASVRDSLVNFIEPVANLEFRLNCDKKIEL